MVKRGLARGLDRGAVAVEFAIVVFWFVFLVMGAIDFGYFFYVKSVVTNAAREGARAGSVIETGTSHSTEVENAASSFSRNYLSNGGLKVTSPPLTTVSATATSTLIGGTTYPVVRVYIEYKVGSLTGFLPTGMVPDARATAVMRWQ